MKYYRACDDEKQPLPQKFRTICRGRARKPAECRQTCANVASNDRRGWRVFWMSGSLLDGWTTSAQDGDGELNFDELDAALKQKAGWNWSLACWHTCKLSLPYRKKT